MAGEKLVRIMQAMNKQGAQSTSKADIVFGEVIQTSPLQVKVDNRFIIDEDFILLSGLCKRKVVNVPIQTTTEADTHTHDVPTYELELWRGLEQGDKLTMLRLSNGQLYYAIERGGDL